MPQPFRFECHDSIHAIPAPAWDALAEAPNPFISHAFLACLEDSGSVGAARGWSPHHLVMRTKDGGITGAAPLYLKTHSQGEFVFDHGWAEAHEQVIGPYYPKLQLCAPFSPVTGPRLMVGADGPAADRQERRSALNEGLIRQAEKLGVSSLHATFLTEDDRRILEKYGLMTRVGCQFHWLNRGYGSFEDFLADLTSRRRKTLRRERREAAQCELSIHHLHGPDIRPSDWTDFHRLYLNTIERKWSLAYLTEGFFQRLGDSLSDRVLMIAARDTDGSLAAAALNLIGDDALYGRYWGTKQAAKFLHFELCYYQAIDFAIANKLARVEAGAQGPHKIQRGYIPVPTYSSHWIRDPGFAAAVKRFLDAEGPAMEGEIEQMKKLAPYRAETYPVLR